MITSNNQNSNKVWDKRLDDMGWGLLLLLTGIVWLLPSGVSVNTWLIGAGVILLGINWARRLNGLPMRAFSLILGIVALAGGVASLVGVELPLFALFLILVGAFILLGPLFEQTPR